jgi:hypothetical protein
MRTATPEFEPAYLRLLRSGELEQDQRLREIPLADS